MSQKDFPFQRASRVDGLPVAVENHNVPVFPFLLKSLLAISYP